MITIIRARKITIDNSLPFLKSYKKWKKAYIEQFNTKVTPEVNLKLWENFWRLVNEQELTFTKYYWGHK